MNFRYRENEISTEENGGAKKENGEKLPPKKEEEIYASRGTENNMDFLEAIYGVIFTPRSAFKFIGLKKPIFWAVGLFVGIFLFNFIISMWGLLRNPNFLGNGLRGFSLDFYL